MTMPSAGSQRDLPEDLDTLLEVVGPQRRAIYDMVRKVLDDLEAATPWRLLYCPPDDDHALLLMETALVQMVEAVPSRVESLLETLTNADLGEHTVEDVDFFFGGIHAMVTHDLERLKGKLDMLAQSAATSEERAHVCELTADIRGKYSSAMMGAAASLIAEGLWNGVEVEPILFPEKAEEFERNEKLVQDLQELHGMIENLPQEVPFNDLVQRWGSRERLDRYVLADLERLKSKLGMLLKASSRRALYSGDYHQIHLRETMLAERLNELDWLHRSTWAAETREVPESSYSRLVELVLQVAAIIDVNIVQVLIGEKACKDLRAAVVTERTAKKPVQAVNSLPEALRPLLPLMSEDDLATFVGMLRGSVLKRLSLKVAEHEDPSATAAAEAAATGEAAGSGPLPAMEPAEELLAPSEELVVDDLAMQPALELTPLLDRTEQLATLRRVSESLKRMRSTSNPSWKGFLMTERLLSKHGRIPPRMFGLALPLIEEILEQLLPQVDEVRRFADVPTDSIEALAQACRYLTRAEVNPVELKKSIPQALETVSRRMAELESMMTEMVVLRSVS